MSAGVIDGMYISWRRAEESHFPLRQCSVLHQYTSAYVFISSASCCCGASLKQGVVVKSQAGAVMDKAVHKATVLCRTEEMR